jgi:hypothetical protein
MDIQVLKTSFECMHENNSLLDRQKGKLHDKKAPFKGNIKYVRELTDFGQFPIDT